MYRKILVPLDESGFAEYALPLAIAMAERSAGELHLVTVVPTLPPVVPAPDREGPVRGWFEEEKVRATQYLDGVAKRLREEGAGASVHIRVLSADPAQALDERIRRTGTELVVMTTHGRGPFERMWIGSVADGLVRRAPCPILLWRPDHEGDERADLSARPRFRSVLVPLDGSTASESIVPNAVALARLFESRLSLLTVVQRPFPVGSPYLPHLARETLEHEEMTREAREYLDGVAEGVRGDGVETDVEVVVDDDPGSAILDHRRRIEAGLVVMSTRGRGGVARLVLGSVADKVIRGGRVPVLVHRPPLEEEAPTT